MKRLRGVIDRRVLINYRVEPEVLERLLPHPFQPRRVKGHGMAGICLLRMRALRPDGMPSFTGFASENASHRIAVEWNDGTRKRDGVFIPRRDTGSRINAVAGGLLFPGVHHRARFEVEENETELAVTMAGRHPHSRVSIAARLAQSLPSESVFDSTEEVIEFFRRGSLGYSPAAEPGVLELLELRLLRWEMQPLEVRRVQSGYFEDQALFPSGSVQLDSALLMRDIEHEWITHDRIHYFARSA